MVGSVDGRGASVVVQKSLAGAARQGPGVVAHKEETRPRGDVTGSRVCWFPEGARVRARSRLKVERLV